MRELKSLKKFAAAFTAVAMVGTFSATVLATEDIPVIDEVEIEDIIEIEDDVEIIENDFDADFYEEDVEEVKETEPTGDVLTNDDLGQTSDIAINSVTAELRSGIYTVELGYAITTETAAPEVTLLGYVFEDTPVVGAFEDGDVKVIEQVTHSSATLTDDSAEDEEPEPTVINGTIAFKLSTAQGLTGTEKLVVMVGSNADMVNAGAQAVVIDLAQAIDTTPAVTPGDLDGSGEIDSADLIATARAVAGLDDLTGDAFEAADIDGSGELDSADLIAVARLVAGLD